MDSEFRPLSQILRELGPLVARRASGFFFIVTEDNHSCTIRLRNGQIDDVAFSRMRNDDAVQLLSHVDLARARFQAIAVSAAGSRGTLSEASLRWLLGGFESAPAARRPETTSARPAASGALAGNLPGAQREQVEQLALNHFGPIAGLLCDEAFASAGDIRQVLAQLAANLPTRQEADRFLDEAATTLGLR